MMTLDEAIKHAEEVADLCEYEASKYDMSDSYESHVACQEGKCAEEHRQLAKWLKELKQLREQTRWIPIKTRPLTEEEKAEMDTESDYMYACPLPDDGEEVEVTTYLGDVTLDVFCRDSSDGCYFEHYCDDGDVLAWRHKPEPYKVESEE